MEIKFYGAFVLILRVNLHAIDATPARWRGDAGSSPLDRARELSGAPDALVAFHTDRDQRLGPTPRDVRRIKSFGLERRTRLVTRPRY